MANRQQPVRRYRVVLLDAQGTLLRAHPSTAAIYAGVCRDLGKEVPEEEIGTTIRELWLEFRRSEEGRTPAYDTSDEATREWWGRFNSRVFRLLGMEDGLERFLEALWVGFGRPENWRLFPEVQEVLVELRGRGYRLGIVSNWDTRLSLISERLGLTPHLDFLLASAATGMEKPDRRIFEIALARAGVLPHQAVHVGDDYETDVVGARAAGVDPILIDRDGMEPVDVPTIRSLVELLALLP